MKTSVAFKILCFVTVTPFFTFANDGFYQGSGYELKPVTNPNLHVIEEKLKISFIDPNVCYPVLYKGKPVKEEQKLALVESKVKLGKAEKCVGDNADNLSAKLRTMWRAEALYHIRAEQKVKNLQFGFPVPEWNFSYTVTDPKDDGLHGLALLAVADFKTWINGKQVKKTTLKRLAGSTKGEDTTSGYTWLASFAKGREYNLKTTYEFGTDYSTGYYEKHQYILGRKPWFLAQKDSLGQPVMKNGLGRAMNLRYYLTPLQSWGKPAPAEISIEVTFPKTIPVEFAVPVGMSPSCVDEGLWTYDIQNQVPTENIDIALPWLKQTAKTSDLPTMQTLNDWNEWLNALGDGVKVSCQLKKRLTANFAEKDKAATDTLTCVETCSAK